jgi:hypothetical protein
MGRASSRCRAQHGTGTFLNQRDGRAIWEMLQRLVWPIAAALVTGTRWTGSDLQRSARESTQVDLVRHSRPSSLDRLSRSPLCPAHRSDRPTHRWASSRTARIDDRRAASGNGSCVLSRPYVVDIPLRTWLFDSDWHRVWVRGLCSLASEYSGCAVSDGRLKASPVRNGSASRTAGTGR